MNFADRKMMDDTHTSHADGAPASQGRGTHPPLAAAEERRPMNGRPGFTLIELLITVAIIAILAAIALPNFQEAQTRAKVARVQAELREIANALETYHADNSAYPPAGGVGPLSDNLRFVEPVGLRLVPLTTPIAYLSAVPQDPYPPNSTSWGSSGSSLPYDTYDYVDVPDKLGNGSGISSGGVWRVMSAGPDRLFAAGGFTADASRLAENRLGVDYDPTNGTVSVGDICRVSSVAAPTTTGGAPDDLSNPERPAILRVPVYREQFEPATVASP